MFSLRSLIKWGVSRWADGQGRRLLRPGGDSVPVDVTIASSVPVIYLPAGSFSSTSGAITLGTALTTVPNGVIPGGGNAYVYLPSGAGGLAGAQLYAATFSSTTQCQLVGNPVTTTTAFAQSAGIAAILQIPIPAGSLGPSGSLDFDIITSNNNSAGSKTVRAGLNATTGIVVLGSTTVAGARGAVAVRNRASEVQQVVSPFSGSFGVIGVPGQLSVDTSAACNLIVSAQLATNTDWLIIESWILRYRYGA